jgi:hypothetical protein
LEEERRIRLVDVVFTMVIVNDFEFQIVTAEDKTPFKEHKKGPNTFVEVEPDAEYFLSVRQVRDFDDKRVCTIDVDGKGLGFVQVYNQIRSKRKVFGIFSWSKGVETMEALKFVKATFTSGDKGIGPAMSGMGKIELKVSNAVFTGNTRRNDFKASFAPSTIQMVEDAAVTMKKNLRSGQGHCAEITNYDRHALTPHYNAGTHLYTITLHYCATPGLIAVGVLPKPPLWDYQRMLKPSNMTPKEKKNLDKAVSVKRDRNGSEILELNDSDDSDSDEDDDAKNNDTDHHKKVKRETISV